MEYSACCTECGFTSADMNNFKSHVEEHERRQRASSGELSNAHTTEWSEENIDSPTSSPLESDGDKSPPKSPEALLSELLTPAKTGKIAHSCPHCNFTTYMSQHMKSHLEAHERHQGQMYQCDICQMQFSQKANMHRHRMRHSGVKPYECRYCKKRFFRKDQMQEHSMTHIKTGADFDCPVQYCSLQFSQHSSLRAHLDETHNISSTQPANCKRCSLLFANSRRLLLHFQTKHDESETSNQAKSAKAETKQEPKEIDENTAKKRRLSAPLPTSNSPISNRILPHSFMPTASQFQLGLPLLPPSAMAALHSQLQNIVRNEPSPNQNTDSSDNSVSPVQDHFQNGNYSLTSEDLLMCLSNTAANNALFSEAKAESAMRIWSAELNAVSTSPNVPAHSPSVDSGASAADVQDDASKDNLECNHCGIVFFDHTLHLLHKGLHSDYDPFRCNLCGHSCGDKYMFTTHIISSNHGQ